MPHRLIPYMHSMLLQIEGITLNTLSLGWIVLDLTLDAVGAIPTWVTVIIGLSIAFLNVARGINQLKKNNDPKKDG